MAIESLSLTRQDGLVLGSFDLGPFKGDAIVRGLRDRGALGPGFAGLVQVDDFAQRIDPQNR